MHRLWPALLAVVVVNVATAQPRCNWCGCAGGPGYRVTDAVPTQYARYIGRCIGHRELVRVCGDPPTTYCQYEGNLRGTGEAPANTDAERRRRSDREQPRRPTETLQPAQSE